MESTPSVSKILASLDTSSMEASRVLAMAWRRVSIKAPSSSSVKETGRPFCNFSIKLDSIN